MVPAVVLPVFPSNSTEDAHTWGGDGGNDILRKHKRETRISEVKFLWMDLFEAIPQAKSGTIGMVFPYYLAIRHVFHIYSVSVCLCRYVYVGMKVPVEFRR